VGELGDGRAIRVLERTERRLHARAGAIATVN
jgi:hypothetical protein